MKNQVHTLKDAFPDFWVRGQPGLQSECQESQGYTEKPCLEKPYLEKPKKKKKKKMPPSIPFVIKSSQRPKIGS
jgi:hypothetical protein